MCITSIVCTNNVYILNRTYTYTHTHARAGKMECIAALTDCKCYKISTSIFILLVKYSHIPLCSAYLYKYVRTKHLLMFPAFMVFGSKREK